MTRWTLLGAALLLATGLAVALWLVSRPAVLPPAGSTQDSMASMRGMQKPREGLGLTPETGMVTIAPERLQTIGVKYEEVARRPLEKVIRTVGRVSVDERRLAKVTIKFHGWIETLFVSATGDHVKKGQVLFTIYSPDLVATQEEYLLALQGRKQLGESEFPEVARGSKDLLEATRHRFHLWDITEDHIRELEKTGKVLKALPIHSPMTGTVIKKEVVQGTHVEPGEELYTIADLSSIWILADIYEYEMPLIKVGQVAAVTLSYDPGTVLHGRVGFVYPTLDPQTRTMKVRLEFPNPGLRLKPDMYAEVKIPVKLGTLTAVPVSAVLDSGRRRIVFVEKGPGMFEPREVTLGPKAEEYVAVTAGLTPGEKVAVGANFLLDAESKLMAAGGMKEMMGQVGMADWQMRGAREGRVEGMPGMKMGGMKEKAVAETHQVAGYSLTFSTVPEKPPVGEALLRLKVTDPLGKPIPNASVVFTYTMPMPGMPELKTTATHAKDGLYEGKAMLGMSGAWEVRANVMVPGQPTITEKFRLAVVEGGMALR